MKPRHHTHALYEATVVVAKDRSITVNVGDSVRDRALLYIDNTPRGVLTNQNPEVVVRNSGAPGSKQSLLLLVENVGRHNWVMPSAKGLFDDQRKGIVGKVHANGQEVQDWKIYRML